MEKNKKKSFNMIHANKLGVIVGSIFALIALLLTTIIVETTVIIRKNENHLRVDYAVCTAVTHEGDRVLNVDGEAYVIFSDMDVNDEVIVLIDGMGTSNRKDDKIIRVFPVPKLLEGRTAFRDVEPVTEDTVETTEEDTVETTEDAVDTTEEEDILEIEKEDALETTEDETVDTTEEDALETTAEN